jgi:hypothetical protein
MPKTQIPTVKFMEKPPYDFMMESARKNGVRIGDPKKNCNLCGGRGIVGYYYGTHNPIPCECVITHTMRATMPDNPNPMTRKQRRKMMRDMKKGRLK